MPLRAANNWEEYTPAAIFRDRDEMDKFRQPSAA